MNGRSVFHDPHGKRHRRVSRTLTVVGVLVAALTTAFAVSLLAVPLLPGMPKANGSARLNRKPLLASLTTAEARRNDIVYGQERNDLMAYIRGRRDARAKARANAPAQPSDVVVAAFYAPWQETGLYSLRANATKLTHLMPEWLHLAKDGKSLDFTDFDPASTPHNSDVMRIARDNRLIVMPILNNADQGAFDPARAHALLSSPDAEAALANALKRWLIANRFQGVNLDFESLDAPDYAKLPGFISVLRRAFQGTGLGITSDMEAGNLSDAAAAIASACDFVVLMAYDEHWEEGAAGPIASIGWTENKLEAALHIVAPEKLVLGIGSYAYDWTRGKTGADSITYQTALGLASDNRPDESPQSVVQLDGVSLNTRFEYDDDAGNTHDVWVLDGVSVFNQWKIGRDSNLKGAALWALGSEDPTVWTVLDKAGLQEPTDPAELESLRFPYEIEFDGEGEILFVSQTPKEGRRTVRIDPSTGLVTSEKYLQYPSSYVVRRSGYHPKELALTFDDGPAAGYSAEILDALKEMNVPGTFFVIGQNAEKYPGLVQRMFDEGHEVGSHTFTHPNMGAVTEQRARLELNATQRVIESILGRATILFRPPYNADAEPSSGEEVRPLLLASSLNYVTVGELIDPQDWNLSARNADGRERTAESISRAVLDQVKTAKGNIILLHDGGGDRSLTVGALRILVPELQKRGYKFVSVSHLMGTTRDKVMPPISSREKFTIFLDRLMFGTLFGGESGLAVAFVLAIFLGLGRVALVTPIAIWHDAKMRRRVWDSTFLPPVTACIAAFNESTVIVRTIRSVLASASAVTEVIVVDDGSSDGTYEAVVSAFSGDPRVRCLRQENQGKAAALNAAMQETTADLVVCIDADTQLAKDAIGNLLRHFVDPRVGAVAGNVRVGNRSNLITTWQSIEYTTSQNLDRRAYASLNAITVVPGAIGAWRRAAVLEVGGYQPDTLAEDMDLTWRLRIAGWKLDTDSDAHAYTEAPDTYRSFFRQRFRWAFGTLQCLFKHKSALFRFGWFGRLALPTLWLFQVVFQALAPLMDLQILYSLGVFAWAWYARGVHQRDWQPLPEAWRALEQVAFLYSLFFVAELISGIVAYRLDRQKMGPLTWLFLQRFVYRQIMYGVIYKSIATAIVGKRQGWGKLDRKATVEMPGISD